MTKLTYVNAQNKKAVRDFLIQYFNFNTVVGLAGPDINDYIKWCKSKGFDTFEVYENNTSVLLNQIKSVRAASKLSIKFGDITQADASRQNVLFDLDFCASVRYLKEPIMKFKQNFIMTFSTRIGVQETIDTFFRVRKESVVATKDVDGPVKHTIFETDNGTYLFIRYFDTSAMCCFAKIA
jgi:hypothetical protein